MRGPTMHRREFIGLIGAAALASPAHAQTNPALPLVGVLTPFKQDDDDTRARTAAIRKGLEEAGLIEGKTHALAIRFAEGNFQPQPPAETVLNAGDVVMAMGTLRTMQRLEALFAPERSGLRP